MRVNGEVETLLNFWHNLHTCPLWFSFEKQLSTSYQEAYNRAIRQAAIEERRNIKRERERVENISEKAREKKKVKALPPRAWQRPQKGHSNPLGPRGYQPGPLSFRRHSPPR